MKIHQINEAVLINVQLYCVKKTVKMEELFDGNYISEFRCHLNRPICVKRKLQWLLLLKLGCGRLLPSTDVPKCMLCIEIIGVIYYIHK